MSGNHSQRPRQSADDFVRSILDDRPTAEVSPSGELFRVIERFHDTVDRARRTISGLSLAAAGGDGLNAPSRNLQRRFSREPASNRAPSPLVSSDAVPSPPLPPLRSYLSRRGSSMSSGGGGGNQSGARWVRYRPSDRYRPAATSSTFADLELRLDSANSHLRALIDLQSSHSGNPPLSPPLMSPPVHSQDPVEDSRRAKRRKLDSSDRLTSSFKGFRYGRYGQVEPGQLTMEIVSCDGGIYTEGSGSGAYAAENILKNDSSVYCTKGSRCNIVLRHQGATVFSLKELIIKAPGSNYSSPSVQALNVCPALSGRVADSLSSVREGMVFISMNKDELLTRTAQYQIQYGRAKYHDRHSAERDGRAAAPIFSIRHRDDGTTLTRISSRRRVHSILDDHQDECMAAQIPSEFTVSPPPFRVTTECSEDEAEGGEASTRYSRQRTPNRIGSLPFESDSGDDWAQVDDMTFGGGGSLYVRRDNSSGGGDLSLEQAVEASQLATQEAVRAVGGTLMAPHARFFIEKDKSKCTIRFDPPVSGRFILLKMWSPHLDHAGNIDIQGVLAKGFAGPRYFPAMDLR